MPCWEVRTVSVEFKAENRKLLDAAIRSIGMGVREENGLLSLDYGAIKLDLKAGKAEVQDGYQNRLNELKQAYSREAVKAALRCGLLELVQKLAGMLGERADGKKKRLSTKAVEAFSEWMDLLPARLVVDDAELKALADKARAVMAGKSPADLRDIGAVREQTRKELEDVGKQLAELVKDMSSRAFGFDE
jgi:hypothetical protein